MLTSILIALLIVTLTLTIGLILFTFPLLLWSTHLNEDCKLCKQHKETNNPTLH